MVPSFVFPHSNTSSLGRGGKKQVTVFFLQPKCYLDVSSGSALKVSCFLYGQTTYISLGLKISIDVVFHQIRVLYNPHLGVIISGCITSISSTISSFFRRHLEIKQEVASQISIYIFPLIDFNGRIIKISFKRSISVLPTLCQSCISTVSNKTLRSIPST